MKGSRGFSLLEVLAAMVIFSAGAALLFTWITSAARQIARLGEEQRQLFGELLAIEYARSLNPMARPSGEIELNNVNVRWTSDPVGDEGPVQGAAGEGNYMVRLYRVRISSAAPNAGARERDLYLPGWREQLAARGSANSLFGSSALPADAPR